MSHSVKFEFKLAPVHKKGEGGKNIYTAIASTAALDRDKEVLVPQGVLTENFMKNPVMLFIHNSRQLPVGRALSIDVSAVAVKFEFEFYDDEVGKNLEKMYRTGFMNAFSVGFRPKSYIPVWDMPNEITSLEVELPDGSKTTINFDDYPERPYGIIPQWELLEISPVPVPSNPEALLQRAKDEMVRKFVGSGNSKAAAGILDSKLSEKVNAITDLINSFVKGIDEEVVVSNVIPYEKSATSSDLEFDPVVELAALSMACTEDASGDKEKIDWAAFSKAFAWFNANKADSYTSYKLMHHSTLPDKSLALSEKGLFASMALLLGQDKTVKDIHADPDELKAVHEHLANHYQDLGLVAPELGKEYTQEQVELIRVGKDPNSEPERPVEFGRVPRRSASTDESEADNEIDLKAFVESLAESVESKMSELEAAVKIRLQVIVRMLEELSTDVSMLKTQPAPTPEDPQQPEQDTRDICTQLLALKSLFNNVTA